VEFGAIKEEMGLCGSRAERKEKVSLGGDQAKKLMSILGVHDQEGGRNL